MGVGTGIYIILFIIALVIFLLFKKRRS